MKLTPAALKAHMASPAATLAWQWIIKRLDGRVYAFTTHVADLYAQTSIPGTPDIIGRLPGTVLCKSMAGFNPTNIAATSSLSQNNLDIEAMLDAAGITEDDLRARRWQAATVEITVVNYEDLSMGFDPVFYGTLGAATGGDLSVKLEQRGITQPLEANMDGVTGPMCRVALGSTGPGKCNKDISSFIRTGTIHSPIADRQFVDPARSEADDWWTKGLITITSGDSIGAIVEIKRSLADGTIELTDELYFGMADGDTYSMTPGCNKLLKVTQSDGTVTYTGDCKTKFDNVLNMQAEPELLGQIAIQQYGGQTVAPADS